MSENLKTFFENFDANKITQFFKKEEDKKPLLMIRLLNMLQIMQSIQIMGVTSSKKMV